MRLDPFPRFPADSSQLIRKLTDLFRDTAQHAAGGAIDWGDVTEVGPDECAGYAEIMASLTPSR
jgi:hypothetical protein